MDISIASPGGCPPPLPLLTPSTLPCCRQNCDDGFTHSPSEVFHYLRATMYQRRNKMNPLWNNLLVGGFKEGQAFLGSVDLIGTAYEDDFLATGFGSYLAIPIFRKEWRADMSEAEARALLEKCMRILFYRDCRALNKIRIAKATAEGTMISALAHRLRRLRWPLDLSPYLLPLTT